MNSTEQQSSFDNSERQNLGDKQQNNPQLNLVDIAAENGGSLTNFSKNPQTADAYLPNFSIEGMSGESNSGEHSLSWGGNDGRNGTNAHFGDAGDGLSLDWGNNNDH